MCTLSPHISSIEHLLNTAEVAKILGYKEVSIIRMRQPGKGSAYFKQGRYVKYRPPDVEVWVNANMQNEPVTEFSQ